MVILGIETSCDETAAAVLQKNGDQIKILSNVISSSASLQQKYGGIIPEQAAREQLKVIIPVIEEAILEAKLSSHKAIKPNSIAALLHSSIAKIDAIAVTYGPGLIGSLLVGVETAKILSLIWNKPLIPVNHLIGHFYANWIENNLRVQSEPAKVVGAVDLNNQSMTANHLGDQQTISEPRGRVNGTLRPDKRSRLPSFPCIGLLVSGGHTDLVLFKNHNKYKYLGGTRDDAAGECFDKCARLLGLPYPGGPEISRLAQNGNPKAFNLPSPMLNSDDYDFSYSGLKTAVANPISERRLSPNAVSPRLDEGERTRGPKRPQGKHVGEQESGMADLNNLCASIELAIIKPLVKKTLKAAQQYNVQTIILGGGVAANDKLVSELKLSISHLPYAIRLHVPPTHLCTDNAAMIASAAFFANKTTHPLILQANPNLSLY